MTKTKGLLQKLKSSSDKFFKKSFFNGNCIQCSSYKKCSLFSYLSNSKKKTLAKKTYFYEQASMLFRFIFSKPNCNTLHQKRSKVKKTRNVTRVEQLELAGHRYHVYSGIATHHPQRVKKAKPYFVILCNMSQNSFPLQFKPLSTMNFDFEKEQASALLYNFKNHFYCFLQLFIRLSLFVTSTFFFKF